MTETKINDTVKAVAALLTTLLAGLATVLGIEPATIPYIAGLIVTGITSLVTAFYAIRRIRTGSVPAQGTLSL